METTVMPAAASVQKQQGLNQVVINKVQRMIESRQGGVMDTINRLLSEGRIAQDFIAPIGVSQRSKERPVISFKAEGRVQMAMPEGNFNLHGNAISQISEKMGIPAKYLRELSAGDVWQKQLCATILNEHSGWPEHQHQTSKQQPDGGRCSQTVRSKGWGTHRSAHPERHAGRAGRRLPAGCRHTFTESAGHPYQPGNVREAGGTGGLTKQSRQVCGGERVQRGPRETGKDGKIA